MKSFLIIIQVAILVSSIYGQSSVNGIVVDSQTNEPLPFANILLGSQIGVASDMDGKFFISSVNELDELTISYVGYKTSNYKISKRSFDELVIIYLNPINLNMQEVTVYSNSTTKSHQIQSSSLTIKSERIKEIAVGMPDILRSVQSLPGVTVNNEFKADYNVRGGNQDENLVLVNGTEVYEPFHLKEAANASIGIFNVDLMRKVSMITGGFPAKYGDKMSSVLDIEYRSGNKDNYSGAASISLAYFDGYAEGPLGNNASFIFGARKSYMEYVLSMIDYEDISGIKPSFYDFQGGLLYDLSQKNKLIFEFIYANDDFEWNPERKYSTKIENEKNIASYTSSMFTLKSKNILSSKALLSAELNYYNQGDNEYRLFEREYKNIDRFLDRLTYDTLKIKTLEFNSNLQYQLHNNYEIQTGISYKNINYDQESDDQWTIDRTDQYQGDYGTDRINANSFKYYAYLENIYSPFGNFTINLGGRVDYFDLNKDFSFSPRLNLAYNLSESMTLKAAWGNFYQSPSYDQLKYSEASDTNTQSQKSTHYILGLDKSFSISNKTNSYLNFKIEGYYKKYDDLISSYYGVFERITYSRENDATGSALGFDIYSALNLPGFYTWISYGYLKANEDIINDNIGEYPRYTDQRHTISLVSNIKLGNNWDISLKAYYGSGFPYTPKTAVKNESDIWVWQSGKRHSQNLPAYKRVDVRISKIFTFEKFNISAFLDVSNIFNFKNIQQYEYSSVPDIYEPKPEEILLWPILPTFGVRFEF